MPNHRTEPLIYTGRIMMMTGPAQQLGTLVEIPYKVAQGLVASGQARWEDDETPMPRHTAQIISERDEKIERDTAEADAISAARKAAREGTDQDAPATTSDAVPSVGQIHVRQRGDRIYLARPFPKAVEITPEIISGEDAGADGVFASADNMIVVRFANANALYANVALEGDIFVYAELREANEPEVEIPADWRELGHLQMIPLAKKVLAVDSKEKVSKADAIEILEDWTKGADDPVQTNDAGGTGDGTARNENGRTLDGNHEGPKKEDEHGKPIEGAVKSPEEIAKEAEQKFAQGDDGF